MTKKQALARFYPSSEKDFFKCLILATKIEEEKSRRGTENLTKTQIGNLKRAVDPCEYPNDQLTLERADFFARQKNFRLKIWVQKTYKHPIYLEFEADITETETLVDLNIFRFINLKTINHLTAIYKNISKNFFFLINLKLFLSRKFDKFENQSFDEIALILDISNIIKKRELDVGNDRVPIRKMRIFQAIVTELFPKLQGLEFDKKVSTYETKWGQDSVNFSDSKRLHRLFGVGIQAWVKSRLPDRKYGSEKIFDTLYKTKVRIIVENNTGIEHFPLKQLIGYVFDESALNYFSCPNKNCFYGTDRSDRLLRHLASCRTETLMKYKQVRYEKPTHDIVQELVNEKILPDANFSNTMFVTYDIGEFYSIF